MADSSKPKSSGGCLRKLFLLIILTGACGLGAAVFFMAQPQDLTDIGGYGPASRNGATRDLSVVLQKALDGGHSVALTEAEINQWLGRTLSAKQGGLLAGEVSLDRVWIRLENDCAEVIMERAVMGRPFTVSMFVKIEQTVGRKGVRTEIHRHGGLYHASLPNPPKGGRFGKLVVPQGFLILVMPAYAKLADLYRGEIRLAFEEMARMRIEKNRLVLDSRELTDRSQGLPQTF